MENMVNMILMIWMLCCTLFMYAAW